MDPLIPYILPLKGLKDGQHQFDFDVDSAFFQAFEDSPVEKAKVKMKVDLDKKPNLLTLNFSFTGSILSLCDRCLTPIDLPVKGDYRLVVKYGEIDLNDDEDVVYIPFETGRWSIAQYVYEYILLSMPLIKVYACEDEAPVPCDLEMLNRLNETKSINEGPPKANPFSEALKDWNK